jgi:hypothetical protein
MVSLLHFVHVFALRFSFGELCQEKMCPLGSRHLQLGTLDRKESWNWFLATARIVFIPRTCLIFPLQPALDAFYHQLVRQEK